MSSESHFRYQYVSRDVSTQKHLQATSSVHGFLQLGLPSAPRAELQLPTGNYIAEWIRIIPNTHTAFIASTGYTNVVGELIVCHRSVHPNQPRIYVWFPIQKSCGIHMASIDALLQKSAMGGTVRVNIGNWMRPDMQLHLYSPFIYASSQPVYVQDIKGFSHMIWSATPLFSNFEYQTTIRVANSVPSPPPSSTCGPIIEGLSIFQRLAQQEAEKKAQQQQQQQAQKPFELPKLQINKPFIPNNTPAVIEPPPLPPPPPPSSIQTPTPSTVPPPSSETNSPQYKIIAGRLKRLSDGVNTLMRLIDSRSDEIASGIETTDSRIADSSQLTAEEIQKTNAKLREINLKTDKMNQAVTDLTNADKQVLMSDGTYVKISDILQNKTTVGKEAFEEAREIECYPAGADKETIEMYNIPVGSAYAGILSQNAMVRMSAVLMVVLTTLVVVFAGIPLVYKAILEKSNNDAIAKGALVFVQFGWILCLLALGLSSLDNTTTMSSAFSMLFLLCISLAYTFFILMPKEGNINIRIADFISGFVHVCMEKTYRSMWLIATSVMLILLIVFKLVGVFTGSAMSIMKWTVFTTGFTVVLLSTVHTIMTFSPTQN